VSEPGCGILPRYPCKIKHVTLPRLRAPEMPLLSSVGGRLSAAIVILLAVIGVATMAVRKTPPPQTSGVASPGARRVSCLGHIEPQDGVVVLSARSLMGQPSIVSELRVHEGDLVSAGQVVAILNSHGQLEAAWKEAEARVAVAERQLAQVEAGAKPADLEAQQAEVARDEAQLINAEADFRRLTALRDARVIASSELEAVQTRVEADRQMVKQARERLASLAEVRRTDVAAARAAVAAARATAERARAEYEPSNVRAPSAGRVLKIRAWPGEEIGPSGLLELGRTDRMYVFADVPEQQMRLVAVGDPAQISGAPLDAPIDGKVERIGYAIGRSQSVPADPAAFAEARVVQVQIRLRDSSRAERLIHAQVAVVINP
jgi:HlyD family secretion protein